MVLLNLKIYQFINLCITCQFLGFSSATDLWDYNNKILNERKFLDALYTDLKSLYEHLHAFVRQKLFEEHRFDNNFLPPYILGSKS